MRRYIHQSWHFMCFCIGYIVGIIFITIFKWNFFGSPWWILASILLFIYAFLRPSLSFVVVALVAGMILGFARAVCLSDLRIDCFAWMVDVRDWFAARIAINIPEPEVKLGISYLLGLRDGLLKDFTDNLRAVGLTHVVVASGTHLSILVDIARKIFGRISRFAGALFSVIFIVLFMAMVGFTASILRAGIMAILTILMWYVGRKFQPWRIIIIAATVTLLIDPDFIGELGWQLSFLSYIGIMIIGPKITQFLYGSTKPPPIASILITTIAATLMTLPLSLYYFGSFSVISLLANLLILPTLPYVMGLVFLTGCLPGLSVLGWLATKLLSFHMLVVDFLGKQTYFIFSIPIRNVWILFLYMPIIWVLIWGYIRQKRRKVLK